MGRSLDLQKRAAWRQRLERQARSGQSVAAFCAREGVSVATYYGWKRKLAANPAAGPKGVTTPKPQSFWPVQIAGAGCVEIELPNGAQVRIPATDVSALGIAIAAAGQVPARRPEETLPC